jgi:hypothetical protein
MLQQMAPSAVGRRLITSQLRVTINCVFLFFLGYRDYKFNPLLPGVARPTRTTGLRRDQQKVLFTLYFMKHTMKSPMRQNP